MTEVEFVSRFQREPTGSWTCTKPLKIDGPNGPLFITQGQSLAQAPCSWESSWPKSLTEWPRFSVQLLSSRAGLSPAQRKRVEVQVGVAHA